MTIPEWRIAHIEAVINVIVYEIRSHINTLGFAALRKGYKIIEGK